MGTAEELVANAVAYAAAGFSVVPLHSPNGVGCDCHEPDCPSPAKHPRTAHGLTDATTDEAAIRRWWSMWPSANVGVVLPAEYVVVDVDVEEVSAALDGRELPTTATAKTGRGWQFLYHANQPVRPAVGVVENVDLRGPGSYVVAPPSRHVNGSKYVWVIPPKDGIAEAPDWIYEAGAAARHEPAAGPDEPIAEGARNAALTRLGGAMRRQGANLDTVVAGLLAENAARCRPPLAETEVRKIAKSVVRYAPEPDVIIRITPAEVPAVGIDAADLLALDIPPLRWVVPDLLPEGTTVLAAPPKIGKSCLVYQIAVEASIGGELLERRVTPGAARYYALEDGKRRGRDRLRAALHGRTLPHGRLEVQWSARRIGEGLEDDIARWLDEHPDAVLVAIDTLGKVRPRSSGRRNAYEVDVEDLGRLQSLFRDRPVALLIVHHARKEAGDDFLTTVSGTYGLTGSADTIVVRNASGSRRSGRSS